MFLLHDSPNSRCQRRSHQIPLQLYQPLRLRRARSHRNARLTHASRPVSLQNRRHHGNRNHQIPPRAQLQKRRRRILHSPRHQYCRQNFIRPPLRLPIPYHEFCQRQPPSSCSRRQFHLRIEREQRRHSIRRRGRIAQIPRHGAPILNLHRAHFPRGCLKCIKTSRQRRPNHFAPRRKPANSNPFRFNRNPANLPHRRNVDYAPLRQPLTQRRIKIRSAGQNPPALGGQKQNRLVQRFWLEIQRRSIP